MAEDVNERSEGVVGCVPVVLPEFVFLYISIHGFLPPTIRVPPKGGACVAPQLHISPRNRVRASRH